MKYVGVYTNEEAAARAWDVEALRLRGPVSNAMSRYFHGLSWLGLLQLQHAQAASIYACGL